MKEIVKTLDINEGNAPQYFTVQNLRLNDYNSAFTQEKNKDPGYAIFNGAAKEVLFPKESLHPFKMNSVVVSQVGSGHCNIYLLGNGEIIHEVYSNHLVNHTFEQNDIQTDTVKNLTKSSELKYKLQPKARLSVSRIVRAKISLFFRQYTCVAETTSNTSGQIQVSVSNPTPYEGEQTTFSAAVDSNTIWEGWYSDINGTQLVSKELTYSSPAKDLTLYAKGTSKVPLNSFYIKKNGIWIKYNKAYKKENGIWVEINYAILKKELTNNKVVYN